MSTDTIISVIISQRGLLVWQEGHLLMITLLQASSEGTEMHESLIVSQVHLLGRNVKHVE